MTINVTKLPTVIIDLNQCLHAAQIKQLMKKMGIKYYTYAFMFNNSVMKYGMSADNDWIRGSFGERIYRQAFQISGWPTKPSAKSAGSDMLDVIKYFPNINKSNVCIKVWDMTSYPFAVRDDPREEILECERTLLDMHEQTFGYLPIGNVRDERKIAKKSRVTDQIFNSMFDTED
jgi:hypothetical protein